MPRIFLLLRYVLIGFFLNPRGFYEPALITLLPMLAPLSPGIILTYLLSVGIHQTSCFLRLSHHTGPCLEANFILHSIS